MNERLKALRERIVADVRAYSVDGDLERAVAEELLIGLTQVSADRGKFTYELRSLCARWKI